MAAGDTDAMARVFAADAWFHDPVAGVLEGRHIPDHLGSLVGRYFDRLEVALVDAVTDGDHAAVEWIQTSWVGERRHELEGTSFVTHRDGQLVRMRDYFQFPPTTTSRTRSTRR
jgi:hypothetical protein